MLNLNYVFIVIVTRFQRENGKYELNRTKKKNAHSYTNTNFEFHQNDADQQLSALGTTTINSYNFSNSID